MNNNILTLTDRALQEIKALLSTKAPNCAIKIDVKKGGCNGKEYKIEYSEEKDKLDIVVEIQGVKILITHTALMFLIGSEMDYVDEVQESGFFFNNPNAKNNCGCGKSFSA